MFGKYKNGVIVYKGKSEIDGENVIAIATAEKNQNRKIGDIVQIWIIKPDINPILAKRLGEDISICGDCKHRDFKTCYVNLGHGPNQIFKAFHNDKYIKLDDNSIFENAIVRIGAYGDPAAIPIHVWDKIAVYAENILGYTHQWNKKKFQLLKSYCMASVETEAEFDKAQSLLWRTFRVKLDHEPAFNTEMRCPASAEMGNKLTCEQCQSCSGAGNSKKSVVINFHRYGFKNYILKRYIKGIKALKNKKKYRINFKQRIKDFKALCKI